MLTTSNSYARKLPVASMGTTKPQNAIVIIALENQFLANSWRNS